MSLSNRYMVMGNLGADAEMTYNPQGKAICTFKVANTKKWTSNGEQREKTTWVKVVAWEKKGELCSGLKKGEKVYVEGEPFTEAWLSKDGSAASALCLTLDEIQFLSPKSGASAPSAASREDVPF